jgi:L,D-peptidoglycan transpeptidase YkuD (ErfK/YbiS/YcfS/YnhG family)
MSHRTMSHRTMSHRTPPDARPPRRVRALTVALVAALGATLTAVAAPAASAGTGGPTFAERVPAATTQVVRTVRTHRWCARVFCTKTQAWEKVADSWRVARRADGRLAEFRSTVGPRGFAAPGTRREGDGTSPTGVYRIKTTFSTTATNPGQMPWRRRLPTSTVTDRAGRFYNVWIEEPGRTDGNRPSMRYGFWVDYNHARFVGDPGPWAVPGLGSGIFYHTSWPGREWIPTQGCTQVGDPSAMRWIVGWLRPEARPRVANNV